MQTLPDFIGSRLKPFTADLPATWELWQHKTLNLHRGVIHRDVTAASLPLSEIRDQVRTVVRDSFQPSWWRGFGFGVVVSLDHLDDSLKHAADLVDVRNNRNGVCQWVVLHFPDLRVAAGIQTWTEGHLAPVYDDLLTALHESGCDCEGHQKDMDPFMKRLIAIQDKLSVAKRVLGGFGLPE